MPNFNFPAIEAEIQRASARGQLIITRAHKLMAYGVTASRSADADYNLPGFIRYEDDLEPLEGDMRISFQEMFQSWTVGNGFRDMLEGVATALDGIYAVLISCKGSMHNQTPKAVEKKFIRPLSKRGAAEKLGAFERDFGISIDTADHIETIVRARNCLTHRFGIVTQEDCGKNDRCLTITWRSLDMALKREDGSIEPIDRNRIAPISQSPSGQLIFRMVPTSLRFDIHQEICIPPRDLEEISVMLRFTVGTIHQLAINWLIENGVLVHGGNKVEPPTVSLIGTFSPKNQEQ